MPITRLVRRLAAATLLAAAVIAQGPQHPPQGTPASVGITYDILACRMPKTPGDAPGWFPDGGDHSLLVGRFSDLVRIRPDGSEVVFVDASAVEIRSTPGGAPRTSANASIVDPLVSFDAATVYFALFEDPLLWHHQRRISLRPAFIFEADVATGAVTQLTFGDDIAFADQSRVIDPPHVKYDISPVELPDGRLLFLSNRDNVMEPENVKPAMRFFRMHADGSNVEPIENFSLGTCGHPMILADGRIVWTHHMPTGRRSSGFPLFVANPDMSDLRTFAGAHYLNTVFHFSAQLGNGDFVTTGYYRKNNYGHGTIIRFPLDPGGNGQLFHPASSACGGFVYGVNDHFARRQQTLVTPWTMSQMLGSDEPAPFVAGSSTVRAGKVTMPAGAPDGHLLMVWSPGSVNNRVAATAGLPHMHVAFAPGGSAQTWDDMTVIVGDPASHYMYPKPLVTYAEIHGIPRPALIPDTPNDGSAGTPVLPANAPFATTGTSSVYNRESGWPSCYGDPWDDNPINSFVLSSTFFFVGQDTYAYPDSAIHAAQIVADVSRFYGHDSWPGALAQRFRSHNNGTQVWGILGETPLRKYAANGSPILDPQNNPDTSYEVRIPADVPFHHRLIDIEGLTLTSEWTWHGARPGERKTNCGGCHAHSHHTTPLDFSLTAAGGANGFDYTIEDFALKTPMVSRDAAGQPSVVDYPAKIRIVEYWQDIQPIFDTHCVSCHDAGTAAGGLRLDAAAVPWDRLAFTDPAGVVPYGVSQKTKYVRRHAASQSLLVWKAYGERLDGRLDSTRSGDIDFGAMPDPNHPQNGVPFKERRLIAAWVDLGCLVDVDGDAVQVGEADPFDDQMKPTVVVGGVDRGYTTNAPASVVVSAYDLHSSLDPDLRVHLGSWTSPDLATQPIGDLGVPVTVPLPTLAKGQTHRILIAVADAVGNVARRELDVTPLDPAALITVGVGSRGTNGIAPDLTGNHLPRIDTEDFAVVVGRALPNAMTAVFWATSLASPPVQLTANAFRYLEQPASFALAATDGEGRLAAPMPIPDTPALNGMRFHFQALVLDPGGQALVPGVVGALTPGLTVVLGG